jgi:hypothetical protein
VNYASLHKAFGADITIDSTNDVRFGIWHFVSSECTYGSSGSDCFEELNPSATDPILGTPNYFRIQAVKVLNGRDGGTGRNARLPTFFNVFSNSPSEVSVTSQAVAVGWRGRTDCTLPFTIAACAVINSSGTLNCPQNDFQVRLTPATTDNVGFLNTIDSGNADQNMIRSALQNNNYCATRDSNTGSSFRQQNGNDLNNGTIDAMTWDNTAGSCLIGTTQIMAVSDSPGCPSNPDFNSNPPPAVIGFVNVVIKEICCPNGKQAVCGTGCPTGGPSVGTPCTTGAAIIMDIQCSAPAGPNGGAGPIFRLVQ